MLDLSIQSRLPNQGLSESEIIKQFGGNGKKPFKEFYRQSAMYYTQFYNKLDPTTVDKTQSGYSGEVQQIRENFMFYHGKQQNTNFYFMQQGFNDGSTVELPIPFMPGQEIGSIIWFLSGQFLSIVQNIKPTVTVINPELKSKAVQELHKIEVMRTMKEFLDEIQKETGYELKTSVGVEGNTDEIMERLYHKLGTKYQVDANHLLKYVQKHSMTLSDLLRGFTNVCVGRRLVTHDNGDGTFDIISPWAYFSVSAEDDDRGKFDMARGIVKYISRADALMKFQKTLDSEELDYLKNGILINNDTFMQFSNWYNYSLFDNDTEMCSYVRVYWKSTVDSRLKIVTNEENERVAVKLKQKSKKKGEMVQIIRYCDILCGHIVADYGIYDVVSDDMLRGDRLYPIMTFQPNYFMGFNQSLVDKLKNIQKEMDAINFRIRENYTMDLGTVLAANGKKFKNGLSPRELYMMLRTNKIHVTTPSGEADDPTDREPAFYKEDVSLMRDVEQYIRLYEVKNQKVSEIANVSQIVRGIQSTYVGGRTQQNSIQQATNSVQYNIVGTIQTFADACTFAIDRLRKKIEKDPTNPKWENLVGEDGVKRILDMKDMEYSDIHAMISLEDTIDPETRARILGGLEALMQGGAIDFEDYVKTLRAQNMSQLEEYAKYATKKKAFREEQMAYANAVSQQNTAETIAQGNQTGREIEAMSRMESDRLNVAGGLAKEVMKQGGSPDEAAALLQGLGQQM